MVENRPVMVIGHQSPDTDSICSAIAYAELQRLIGNENYIPCRTGSVNQETAFVLHKFGVPSPKLVHDVCAQVSDMDIRRIDGVSGKISMRRAWEKMRDEDIHSLTIVDDDNSVEGIITVQDIAMANMDKLDVAALSQSETPISNVIETLCGELICGDPDTVINRGNIVIGAASPEVMEANVHEGDIVLCANRYETQLCAIELNASCIVVCLAPTVAKTIIALAKEHNCTIISTPFDTYTASQLISQSVPIRFYMKKDVLSFSLSTSADDVKRLMGQVRYTYFPILDADKHYFGMISKRNAINLRKKQLVLVDHNEKSQCVDGFEQAEILGIIDHHRIADLETSGPVFFRNQPVGCTATIIYNMYLENNVKVPKNIAGLLCCAILSDTLAMHSPTSTKLDEYAATELAKIADVELDSLAEELFNAGESLTNLMPEDVLFRDYKTFLQNGIRFGVAQGTYNTETILNDAKNMMLDFLPKAVEARNVDMLFYIATSVHGQSSDVICAGKNSELLLANAFNLDTSNRVASIKGLMSRKKQFIPAILNAIMQNPDIYK